MWAKANQRYVAEKDSQGALVFLANEYERLTGEERPAIDRLIAEKVLSREEWERFDALFLVDKFRIRSASSSLYALAERLATDNGPSAPFELDKVERIIGQIAPPPVAK